jgi:hypothetical protein
LIVKIRVRTKYFLLFKTRKVSKNVSIFKVLYGRERTRNTNWESCLIIYCLTFRTSAPLRNVHSLSELWLLSGVEMPKQSAAERSRSTDCESCFHSLPFRTSAPLSVRNISSFITPRYKLCFIYHSSVSNAKAISLITFGYYFYLFDNFIHLLHNYFIYDI